MWAEVLVVGEKGGDLQESGEVVLSGRKKESLKGNNLIFNQLL